MTMTDEEFEILWALEQRSFPCPGVPDIELLAAYVAKHPDGIMPLKLCRRFEAEGYSRANAQLAVQRVTDQLCSLTRDYRIVSKLAEEVA